MKPRAWKGIGGSWRHEIRGADEVRRWLLGGAMDEVAIGADE